MELLLKLVLFPILLQYGVHGVSKDYVELDDEEEGFDKISDQLIPETEEDYDGSDQYPPENCIYGESFTIDCNNCSCNLETGITKCTRKKCKEGTFSRCTMGTNYMKDCNQCYCSMRTGRTLCTKKECPPVLKNDKCPEGHSYSPDGGCNYCSCDLKTGNTFCTLVRCLHRDPLSNQSPKQLEKNKKLVLKIKEAATGCKPPEVIIIGMCRCDCRLSGVVVCKESCFLRPGKGAHNINTFTT